MKKFGISLIVLISLLLSSCANILEERTDSVEYGTLVYRSNNRSIDVSSIHTAKVSVMGIGIDYDLSITVPSSEIKDGVGTFIIDKIPVGKNRVVSVQAYDVCGEPIPEALISVVMDITVGTNELLLINKETSCEGNVYKRLFEEGYDISNFEEGKEDQLLKLIPTIEDCFYDLSRLDVDGIVKTFLSLDDGVDILSVYPTDFVLPEEAYLQRLVIKHLEDSTEVNPKFSLVALYSDGTEKDVTSEAEWYIENKSRTVITEDFMSLESGSVTFANGSEGNVEIYGVYTDPADVEQKYTRTSAKAYLDVQYEAPEDNYIYFYNDPEPLYNTTSSKVNYALHGVKVAAWIEGGDAGDGYWYPLEVVTVEEQEATDGSGDIWKHPIWMRVELPVGAEKVTFARGKYLDGYDDWADLKGLHDGNPYNKTFTYTTSDFESNNIYTPTDWNAAHWYYCSTDGCEFGTKEHKITGGEWSYKSLEELEEELQIADLATGYSYAKVSLEPTEDDTSLSSITVNGTQLVISHRIVHTLPYVLDGENDTVIVNAVANHSGAVVEVTPYAVNIPNGEYAEFEINVTSENQINQETFVVKVKRATAPVISGTSKPSDDGICYILDDEEKVATFVFEYDKWGYSWNKENIIAGTESHRVILRGSFTRIYKEAKGAWSEDVDSYVMTYDENNDWYFVNVPYEKLRPGYSGQPEYNFYVDLRIKGWADADFIDTSAVFNENEKRMMVFFGDESEERLEMIENNKTFATEIKAKEDFDVTNEQGRANVSNFRLVPGTTSLYRSYHPFYPTHEDTPTELVRIQEIQEYIEEVGIKSDINLCDNHTNKEGRSYIFPGYDEPYYVTIPDSYNEIIENDKVLYVGDADAVIAGNGVIPEGEHVYYNSDSQYMVDWIKQIVDFVNMEDTEGPFLIHCEIGVDRTGVFSAIFAGLCGASWEQIAEDFKASANMQIGEFRDIQMLEYSFEKMLGVEDITVESDIESLLVNYFVSKGIVQADLDSAVEKLTSDN